MKRLFFLPLILLAACATPREQCIASATKDIRVLDRLIAESKGNMERGYGYGTERYTSWQWGFCGYHRNGALAYCWEPFDNYRRVPVAVDLTEEQKRLGSMIDKRAQLEREARTQIAACNTAYPGE